MTFISYAQNYEDVILWRALHDVERGFYVDVGAADPEIESVTHAFYERGWSGINIEPVDEYFVRSVQARPRDTNLKLVVGREAGLRIVHTFPGTGLSTLDAEIARKNRADGYAGSEIQVPMLTLRKVLEDCAAPPTIHFLKIDVEGTEKEVLEGLDLERVRPWIIVVEANKPNSTESNRSEWEHLVTSRAYGFAYFDGLNCFYVADEAAALKQKLALPPNVFDDFMRAPELAVRQECAVLKQEVLSLRGNMHGLETALRAQMHGLEAALRAQMHGLEVALEAERAQTVSQRNAKRTAQEQLRAIEASSHQRLDDLSRRVQYLSTQLAMPSVDRAIGRVLHGIRQTGDRLTGGGLRSLARRVLTNPVRKATVNRTVATPDSPSNATAPTDQPATERDASPPSSRPEPRHFGDNAESLSVSARSAFARLKVAISNTGAWNGGE